LTRTRGKAVLITSVEKIEKKRLEKELIILYLGVDSSLRGLKEGKTSLNLLSMSTIGPLINLHWHFVRNLSDS